MKIVFQKRIQLYLRYLNEDGLTELDTNGNETICGGICIIIELFPLVSAFAEPYHQAFHFV
jgi:hypothetical protein